MKTPNQLQIIESTLDGPYGVLYLMFLGAERYVGEIQKPLVKSGFYRKKENVNQTFYKLMKQNHNEFFLKFLRKETKPGIPQIYTANYEPLFLTLRSVDSEIDEEELKHLLNVFSFLNEGFPAYLINGKGSKISHRSLKWKIVLAKYFHYLSTFFFLPYIYEMDILSDNDKEKVGALYSFVTDPYKVSLNTQTVFRKKMDAYMKGKSKEFLVDDNGQLRRHRRLYPYLGCAIWRDNSL